MFKRLLKVAGKVAIKASPAGPILGVVESIKGHGVPDAGVLGLSDIFDLVNDGKGVTEDVIREVERRVIARLTKE